MDPNDLRDIVNHMSYPCDRADLLRQATATGAGDGELGPLGALPDQNYDSADSVRQALAELPHTP